jgi:hypothetical protein
MNREELIQSYGWLLTYAEINIAYYGQCGDSGESCRRWITVAEELRRVHQRLKTENGFPSRMEAIVNLTQAVYKFSEIERTEKRPDDTAAYVRALDEAQKQVQSPLQESVP